MINFSFGLLFIPLLLLVAYLILMYKLAMSKKDRRVLFYFLALLPIFFGLALNFNFLLSIYSLLIVIVGSFLYLLFSFFWATQLYKSAGNEKWVWFLFIFFIPPLWILYWVVKIND